MEYFENLLKEGYYILIVNCIWNGIEYKDYRVQKDISDTQTSIACHLNLKGFREVKKKFKFPISQQIQTSVELNRDFKPYALQFETQTKEPLKITFS